MYFKIIFTTTTTTYMFNIIYYNELQGGCSNFKIQQKWVATITF